MATDIESAAGPVVERFASSSGRVFGFVAAGVGLVLAVGVLLTGPASDLGLLLFGLAMALIAYVVLIRPVVVAHQNGVVLRNMLRDTFVPWTSIERTKVLQTLQVVTDGGTYHGFGVTRSTRSMVKEDRRRLRSPGAAGFGAGAVLARGYPIESDHDKPGTTYQAYVESRIQDLAVDARKKSSAGQPLVVWAVLPIIGLLGAVACVLGMLLL